MRRPWLALIAGLIVGTTLTVVVGGSSNEQGAPVTKTPEPVVTPVAGPSWLNRLGLTYRESSLGRSGATSVLRPRHRHTARRPRHDRRSRARHRCQLDAGRVERRRPVPVQLSILPSGRRHGSPPEIKSVLGLVQGSSLELVRQHLKEEGKRPLARRLRRKPLERGPTSTSESRRAGNGCRHSRTCRRPISTCSTPT